MCLNHIGVFSSGFSNLYPPFCGICQLMESWRTIVCFKVPLCPISLEVVWVKFPPCFSELLQRISLTLLQKAYPTLTSFSPETGSWRCSPLPSQTSVAITNIFQFPCICISDLCYRSYGVRLAFQQINLSLVYYYPATYLTSTGFDDGEIKLREGFV